MSLLSRYPLGQFKVRTPFADKTNEDDGEGAFFAQSRKALKKTQIISKPSAKNLPSNKGNGSGRVTPNLVISTTSHPGVSRVISESGVLSPPLNSLLHMHERKVRRSSFPKRRSLVELEDVGSLSMSPSSTALGGEFVLLLRVRQKERSDLSSLTLLPRPCLSSSILPPTRPCSTRN